MGNFSKNPDAVLQDALAKGYNRVLFQQGKPVLDRELNLFADLVSPQRLIEHHIGNGVPAGDDGFRISNLDVAQNDFSISEGRCLVGGYEVKLAASTTYKTQPYTANVAPLPTGTSYVYLHVFTSEVDHTEDSDLTNTGTPTNPDVGFETAVRRKVEWEVRVETGGQTGADYFLLAVITTSPPTVTDRRRIGLTMASMRDEITTARGALASLDARLDVSLNDNGTLANGATVTGDLIVNGKIGIGTTTPQNKLDVEGGAVIGATYSGTNIAPTNGLLIEGNVGIGTLTPQNKLDVEGGAVIGATYSGTNAAPTNGLLVEGNVGIGNTAPRTGAKLEVSSGSLFISQANDYVQIDPWVSSNGCAIAFYENSQHKANLYWHKLSQTFLINSATPATNTVLNRNGGNVGIGTPTPQNKLDVEGGAVIGAAYSGTNAAPTNGLLIEGNVGIGTTTPDGILHVSKSSVSTTHLLKMGNQNQPSREWSFDIDGSANMTLNNEGGGSAFAALFFKNDGSVGIGATPPLDTLDINGDLRVRGGDIKDSSGTQRISLPASGNLDLKDAGGTSRITIVDNGNLELKEDNGTMVLTINTDSRVGINTADRLSKLTIRGGYGWKTGTVAVNNGSALVTGSGTSFLSWVGVGDQIFIREAGNVGGEYRIVTSIASDTSLTVDQVFTSTRSGVAWWVSASLLRVDEWDGTTRFIVTEAGTVGIGTVLPSGLLDVRGTIKLHTDGSHYAPGGLENLRVIRGTVQANGTILNGTGFTVQIMSTGIYHVTFSQSFAGIPTVVATQHYPDSNDFANNGGSTLDNCVIIAVSTTRFRIKCGDGAGNASNRRFEFVAMGPR